jgi:predicted flap endonuclease-1-like 5' DNA nuclease
MSTIAAFVLGLLIGWIVEWVIDWVYWRRRTQAIEEAEVRCNQKLVELDRELVALKQSHAHLNEEALRWQNELQAARQEALRLQNELRARQAEPALAAPEVVVPDDLEVIRGIGPAIDRKLNQAGVYTFEQLAELTPLSLRSILGDMIERLANEESLITQARQLAERKASQTGKEA